MRVGLAVVAPPRRAGAGLAEDSHGRGRVSRAARREAREAEEDVVATEEEVRSSTAAGEELREERRLSKGEEAMERRSSKGEEQQERRDGDEGASVLDLFSVAAERGARAGRGREGRERREEIGIPVDAFSKWNNKAWGVPHTCRGGGESEGERGKG